MNEESKDNSKTVYKKRQIGTRMRNPSMAIGGQYEENDDEFTNRFGDYLGSGRAGGVSMRTGSMAMRSGSMAMRSGSMTGHAPKFSIHKK